MTTWHTGAGDGLLGDRIVVQCRKLGKQQLVNRSGTHKAQKVVASQDAQAWIEVPRRTATTAKPKL